MVAGLVYILVKEKAFKPARFVLIAITPYIVLQILAELLRIVNKSFYKAWDSLIDTTVFFAVVWGIGTWWITNRQKKALEKEKTKTKEEEQQNRIMTAMKAQLEVQVAERTAELTKQKEALQITLDELKSTQAQLIQAEKMASLGELTAGIAHEIQNPLNFVNNFSEVSVELAGELKDQISTIDIPAAQKSDIEDIMNDIVQNQEKINFHGKRADGIVKGMLQHSRNSSGQKEISDINALVDEYLRLSYHGLRAKDKTFNATMKTDYDQNLQPVSIVPQEIGRAVLNLFTNAFYSVTQKKALGINGYEPTVYVSTKKIVSGTGKNMVEIKVKDNGMGVPQKVIEKIFQPFFTTKPSGQGTGLGLSLTYDIVTKSHGGEINVVTADMEGAEFVILLPVQ
jgi:two-component system, NtrC family, sensor kinase